MEKKVGAPKGNTNAEKWTHEEAEKFMLKAVELSNHPYYDFIGEIAFDLDTHKGTFDYLVEKFEDLDKYRTMIKSNCEVNCFRNMKKENINVATGMINLKSNHGWTDRIQTDNTNRNVSILNIDPLADESDDNA